MNPIVKPIPYEQWCEVFGIDPSMVVHDNPPMPQPPSQGAFGWSYRQGQKLEPDPQLSEFEKERQRVVKELLTMAEQTLASIPPERRCFMPQPRIVWSKTGEHEITARLVWGGDDG